MPIRRYDLFENHLFTHIIYRISFYFISKYERTPCGEISTFEMSVKIVNFQGNIIQTPTQFVHVVCLK